MASEAPTKRRYRMSARAEAAAQTAERLLAAAWRHFSASPYEQVRLSDIATDADVSLQTLHTHFGTKEQLFVSSYEWWWVARSGSLLHSAPVGDIQGTVRVLLAHADEHGPAILRLLSQEDNIPAVRERMDAGRVYHREWVAKTFAPQLAGLKGAARERRIARLIVATDIFTWKRLRQDMRLSRATVEQIVAEIIDPPKGTHG
jgi:AcrR family transcriptional regulator